MRRAKTKEPAPRLQKYMLGAIALAAIVVITVAYFRFYHIDMSRLNYAIGAGASESAEGTYRIAVSIYPIGDVGFMESEEIREGLEHGDIEGYVIARLYWNPAFQGDVKIWDGRYSKIVFYDKYDGTTSFIWADGSTLIINGVTLKMPNQTFDYRRPWFV